MLPGEIYHVFNHANGWENLFVEKRNYDFFLKRLAFFTYPACKLLSYCLMPNHYHLVIQVSQESDLQSLWKIYNVTSPDNPLLSLHEYCPSGERLIKRVRKTFSNTFNSYAQAFNKVYSRKGSLFRQNMKTILIPDKLSLCKVIYYLHANPVHHGFTAYMEDWPHSSYRTFLSKSKGQIEKEFVLNIFGGLNEFVKYHQQ